jgi:5-methylcytosine-specific restriction endonuclease McrA
MKKSIFIISLLLIIVSLNSIAGTIHVKGYYRKDGTYVHPYDRKSPGSSSSKESPENRKINTIQPAPTAAPRIINPGYAPNRETPKDEDNHEPTIITPETYQRINEYFRAANENVGALDCNVVIHPRDVDDSLKDEVRSRDGNCCVVCGGQYKLEVDHRRALENGGTNDIDNLALLCDTCHTIKTKYDNSLRRKRETFCGKKGH